MGQSLKQRAIIEYLNVKKVHLAVLTETWLTCRFKYRIKGARVLQSPPSPHQGVMIVAAGPIYNLQPILEDRWSRHLIAGIAHLKAAGRTFKLVIIGVYLAPQTNLKNQQKEELIALIRHTRQKYNNP